MKTQSSRLNRPLLPHGLPPRRAKCCRLDSGTMFQCLTVAVMVLTSRPLIGQLSVSVGEHVLLPNTPGQEILITVAGNVEIAGLNFNVQIGDGYPDVPGSVLDGPDLSEIDIVGSRHPTIFTGNNTGQQDPGSGAQIAFRTTTTAVGGVVANGLLATLVVDTTGFSAGEYPLLLNQVFGGSTSLVDLQANETPVTITDGVIRLSPKQPQTIAFPAIGSKMLGAKPFAVAATASSGLPVGFEIVTGPATVTGDVIALTGVGEVTVRATQAGNGQFAAAEAVVRSFTVIPAPNPAVKFSYEQGLLLEGSPGLKYRVEFAQTLAPPIPWRELTTLTVTHSAQAIPDTKPGKLGQGYYRVVLVIE